MTLRWRVYGFRPGEDALAAEVPAPGLDAPTLRALIGAPADDPMFDSYPLSPVQRDTLAGLLGLVLDPGLDWFAEVVEDGD